MFPSYNEKFLLGRVPLKPERLEFMRVFNFCIISIGFHIRTDYPKIIPIQKYENSYSQFMMF